VRAIRRISGYVASCDGKGYVASCDGKREDYGRSPDQQPASNQYRSCRRLSGASHAIASQKCDVNEGQRTEGHIRYPGASNAITIIVDLRSEHDLKVLLEVGHTDSATNMQVIGLAFNGRRWYFVSANGERAETLFLVEGFFRTRTEAGLTYRSQSQGELDRALDRRRLFWS